MAWSRKSAMFAALAIAMYLLGLVLRNSQLVTVAVVLLSFLTWAAFRTSHAHVASSGRRVDDADADEGSNCTPFRRSVGFPPRGYSRTARLMSR
ncbi:MAG: hypothetical protein Ct9H300mP10_05240 [Methanobacteriota archaeon]|nr:MAG: hypothetical protein Ct9H300mP10_05240 [Euryarchaeota archaeon]